MWYSDSTLKDLSNGIIFTRFWKFSCWIAACTIGEDGGNHRPPPLQLELRVLAMALLEPSWPEFDSMLVCCFNFIFWARLLTLLTWVRNLAWYLFWIPIDFYLSAYFDPLRAGSNPGIALFLFFHLNAHVNHWSVGSILVVCTFQFHSYFHFP